MSKQKRKKIPEKPNEDAISSIPVKMKNPIVELLDKANGVESVSQIEFASRIENTHELYCRLLMEGFFLPSEECFSKIWAKLWLLGVKDFLPLNSVKHVIANYNCPDLNWELLYELMKQKEVSSFFWWDDKVRPNFDYIYRVLATKIPDFDFFMVKQKDSEPRVYMAAKRKEYIMNLPVKQPSSNGYKKLSFNAIIDRVPLNELETFCKEMEQTGIIDQDQLSSFKQKHVLADQQDKIEHIGYGEKVLAKEGRFTSKSQVVPLLAALSSVDVTSELGKFVGKIADPEKWERFHDPSILKKRPIMYKFDDELKNIPAKMKMLALMKTQGMTTEDLKDLEKYLPENNVRDDQSNADNFNRIIKKLKTNVVESRLIEQKKQKVNISEVGQFKNPANQAVGMFEEEFKDDYDERSIKDLGEFEDLENFNENMKSGGGIIEENPIQTSIIEEKLPSSERKSNKRDRGGIDKSNILPDTQSRFRAFTNYFAGGKQEKK